MAERGQEQPAWVSYDGGEYVGISAADTLVYPGGRRGWMPGNRCLICWPGFAFFHPSPNSRKEAGSVIRIANGREFAKEMIRVKEMRRL